MFVQVILPLRLAWLPAYKADGQDLHVGDRVRVRFAGREYVGVVSQLDVTPDIEARRIQPVLGVEDQLPAVLPSELAFWQFISEYYLCSIGEVYKYVYPASRNRTEEKKARRALAETVLPGPSRLDAAGKRAAAAVLAAFDEERPVLLQTARSERIESELVRRCLESGRDVLVIEPDAARESYVTLRDRSRAVREGGPVLIRGSKANLFLPFVHLGLVIVRDEHSERHKQSALAPRFHARDAAVMLARQCGAQVLLVSDTPSLESLFNCRSGRYALVRYNSPEVHALKPELIDTSAELRKNGMVGGFSRILIAAMGEAFERKEHVLLLLPWKDTRDVEIEARGLFPKVRTLLEVLPLEAACEPGKYQLAALLRAEYLLGRSDFRSDEKAVRIIHALSARFPRLLVQTADTGYAVLDGMDAEKLLQERRQFSLPPYTRIVDLSISDPNEARRAKMTQELTRLMGGSLRLVLLRDRSLAARKAEILAAVNRFEAEKRYVGHVVIDVDPV